jgi:hypothetical protein
MRQSRAMWTGVLQCTQCITLFAKGAHILRMDHPARTRCIQMLSLSGGHVVCHRICHDFLGLPRIVDRRVAKRVGDRPTDSQALQRRVAEIDARTSPSDSTLDSVVYLQRHVQIF